MYIHVNDSNSSGRLDYLLQCPLMCSGGSRSLRRCHLILWPRGKYRSTIRHHCPGWCGLGIIPIGLMWHSSPDSVGWDLSVDQWLLHLVCCM